MQITYPRLRYILLTMTQERGSLLESYSISESGRGTTIRVKPARFIAKPEFRALAAGLSVWQERYLDRGQVSIDRDPDGSICYTIAFSDREMYARILWDEAFLKQILAPRALLIPEIRVFTQAAEHSILNNSQSQIDSLMHQWQSLVARLFAVSVPFVLVDEWLLHDLESLICRQARDPKEWWNELAISFRSPYVQAAANGCMNPLPDCKEWTDRPLPLSVPPKVDAIYSIPTSAAGSTPSTWEHRLRSRGPVVYAISEETHYLLGALLLAGNHLWLYRFPSVKGRHNRWDPPILSNS